jgi:hypothetical protein
MVARVFPPGDEPAPVPLHLAVCAECQSRVVQLREAWLLDRGATDGVVEALPDAFWSAQSAAVMAAVVEEGRPALSFRPAAFARSASTFVRRPVMAFGSLAAALALVASLTVLRPSPAPSPSGSLASARTPVPTMAVDDSSDDELLRSIDSLLDEASTAPPELEGTL